MLTPQVTYYRSENRDLLDQEFLFYALQADSFQRKLRSLSAQSTRAYVGITAQRSLKIRLPPFEVQRKVIERVKKLDKVRQQVDTHCEATELLAECLRDTLLSDVVGGGA